MDSTGTSGSAPASLVIGLRWGRTIGMLEQSTPFRCARMTYAIGHCALLTNGGSLGHVETSRQGASGDLIKQPRLVWSQYDVRVFIQTHTLKLTMRLAV